MYKLLLIASLFSFAPYVEAQENPVVQDVAQDDLGNVTDAFQESFFEALKQKGIENYDRAIQALDKCISIRPQEAILYFEKGKNLALLGDAEEAEKNYLKALQLKPNQRDIMESLYEIYYAQQNFGKAIDLVKKLTAYDPHYKEDLARIYLRTHDYDKALSLLDELDHEMGKDDYREQIRRQIYALSKGDLAEKDIVDRIAKNPKDEQNYRDLILVYMEQGETEKGYAIAQKLLKIDPKADAAQLAFYKYNLDKGDIEEAVNALKKALKSPKIEGEIKQKLLNDFLIYVQKHPEYQPEVDEAIALFSEKEDPDVNEKLGSFYLQQADKTKALDYYLNAYKKDPGNFDVLKNLMILQLGAGKLPDAIKLGEEGQSLYPTQPIFYLIAAVAYNKLAKPQDAKNALEAGLDYVIENPQMEKDFYKQLSLAYKGNGDTKKAEEYKKKAEALE